MPLATELRLSDENSTSISEVPNSKEQAIYHSTYPDSGENPAATVGSLGELDTS